MLFTCSIWNIIHEVGTKGLWQWFRHSELLGFELITEYWTIDKIWKLKIKNSETWRSLDVICAKYNVEELFPGWNYSLSWLLNNGSSRWYGHGERVNEIEGDIFQKCVLLFARSDIGWKLINLAEVSVTCTLMVVWYRKFGHDFFPPPFQHIIYNSWRLRLKEYTHMKIEVSSILKQFSMKNWYVFYNN
jgi:hypothetical protein